MNSYLNIVMSLVLTNLTFSVISNLLTATADEKIVRFGGPDLICSTPPTHFPSELIPTESNYVNWAKQITLDHVWTVNPVTVDEIVTLANWAVHHGYRIRPVGRMHNWSPLVVTGHEKACGRTILVNTTAFLVGMKMADTPHGHPPAVTSDPGVLVQDLLAFIQFEGYGILGHPAPGDVTVGGAIAIGGHGTGVFMKGQVGNRGTMSNLVTSVDVIVWNEWAEAFEIKTFKRGDPETRAVILNLGRLFITQVTLEVTPVTHLRCQSRIDISAKTLFANPSTLKFGDSPLISFLEESGSVETTWFPFTNNPWLKVWTVADTQPFLSRRTNGPYNYEFTDNIPEVVSDVADKLLSGSWALAPTFGELQLTVISTGLITTLTFDLWGPSHHVLLYVKPTTLRLTANGYALITPRSNVQSVLHDFTVFYEQLIDDFAEEGKYPVNGPLEIRLSSMDGHGAPLLSALKPIPGKPEFDTAIWIDTLTYANSPYMAEFMETVEEYLLKNLTSSKVIVRPEWSKGFAYTKEEGWANWDFLSNFTPSIFDLDDWNYCLSVFKKYDPNEVFTNEFLRRLLK